MLYIRGYFSVGTIQCCFCKHILIDKLQYSIMCTNELKKEPMYPYPVSDQTFEGNFIIYCDLFEE
jgi:hypothetical protein